SGIPLSTASPTSISEYTLNGSSPESVIVNGPNDTLWISESNFAHVSAIQVAQPNPGTTIEYISFPTGSHVYSLIEGFDGQMWFSDPNQAAFGRISGFDFGQSNTPNIVEWNNIVGGVTYGVVAGNDNNLYFTDAGPSGSCGQITKVTVWGSLTHYPLPSGCPTGGAVPYQITNGP